MTKGGKRLGAGRKANPNARKRYTFRSTVEEWNEIESRAKLLDMDRSKYIRHRCLGDKIIHPSE